jgi:ribosomal protein L11 methyltransferase
MRYFIAVHFKTIGEERDKIIARLMDIGYDGAEEKPEEIIGYIDEINFDESPLLELKESFKVDYNIYKIEQQNWNAEWESSFEPVVVGSFAAIRASFHRPVIKVQHDIIITPKMSFGTGHHATTYLVIELMKEIDFTNKKVIDFGTGTGILAILAEKLGAGHVLAIDNDEWSINNSEENIAANGCNHIDLRLAGEMVHQDKADIILANINLNVIVANLQKIKEACNPGASVLFSGLMTTDEENISNTLKNNGFHIENIAHRNGWIALLTTPVLFPRY